MQSRRPAERLSTENLDSAVGMQQIYVKYMGFCGQGEKVTQKGPSPILPSKSCRTLGGTGSRACNSCTD